MKEASGRVEPPIPTKGLQNWADAPKAPQDCGERDDWRPEAEPLPRECFRPGFALSIAVKAWRSSLRRSLSDCSAWMPSEELNFPPPLLLHHYPGYVSGSHRLYFPSN